MTPRFVLSGWYDEITPGRATSEYVRFSRVAHRTGHVPKKIVIDVKIIHFALKCKLLYRMSKKSLRSRLKDYFLALSRRRDQKIR